MKYLLNTLLVSYIALIFFAGMPEINTLSEKMKNIADDLSMKVGLWPSWSMFAPNPVRFDSKSYIVMTYKNGTVQEEDAEIPLGGILAPFRSARWTKWAQDNLRQESQRDLLPAVVDHFYERFSSEENPILFIQVKLRTSEVVAFDEKNIPSIFDTPKIKNEELLYTYKAR